jgi:hypothetical protein
VSILLAIPVHFLGDSMSYPSIKEIAPDFLELNPTEQEHALWNAFHVDLPLGLTRLKEIVAMNSPDIQWHDPNGSVGKEIIRLLGCDISRRVCESNLGVHFALYNCCGVSCSEDIPVLSLSAQYLAQLTANC